MSELKNCPFCNEMPELFFDETDAQVYCTKCGFTAPKFSCEPDVDEEHDAITQAVNHWNTRTASSRFTAEEMEAMNHVIFMAMATASGKRDVDAIVTVKQMLEGSV